MNNPSAPADSRARLPTLDSLRGLAALAVMWFHLTNGSGGFPDEGLLRKSGEFGWLGVEVFFVISGFVLPYSLSRSSYQLRDFWIFVIKRLVRLEPPYLACIAIVLILNYLSSLAPTYSGEPFHVEPGRLALHLGYLNDFAGVSWLSPVFWTLAIEFQFYLLLAITFPVLFKGHAAVRLASVMAMLAISLVWHEQQTVFRFLFLFAMGGYCFCLREAGLSGSKVVKALIFSSLFMGAAFTLGGKEAAAGAVTCFMIANVRIAGRLLAFLGSISYSLYLLHVPVGGRIVNLGSRFADSSLSQFSILLLAAGLSVAAAYMFYRLVERPAQNCAARMRYRRQEKL